MIKYQILSSILWPEIKLNKKLKKNWTLFNIRVNNHNIKLEFRKQKEKIILLLNKFSGNSIGKISKNFRLSILAKDKESAKNIINKNKEFIRFVAAVVKKNDTADFLFLESIDYYKKNPFGIVFTITHKCTMKCKFCFNSYDYDLKKRNKLNDLTTEEIKKIIDKFYNAGIRYIILSGGEPLIRNDFFKILDYLVKKKIYIVINTNGVLINDDMASKISKYPVHIMMSLHQFNDKDAQNDSGMTQAYSKKISAINSLRKHGVMCLEYITILDRKNIDNLQEIYKISLTDLKPDNWQFFRVFDSNDVAGSTKKEMKEAIDKIDELNKKYNLNYNIVDSVPYCVHSDLEKSNRVVSGDLQDSHIVKLVTDPVGNIKLMGLFHIKALSQNNSYTCITSSCYLYLKNPSKYPDTLQNFSKKSNINLCAKCKSYFVTEPNLGNALVDSVRDCWNNEFSQKLLNLKFVPKECKSCKYFFKCGGGSRMMAHIHTGSYYGLDPLVDLENIKA